MLNRLKLIRLKKNITQKELSDRSKIPVWKIARWEEGKRKPSLIEVLMVQKALIGTEELFILNPTELKEMVLRLEKQYQKSNVPIL